MLVKRSLYICTTSYKKILRLQVNSGNTNGEKGGYLAYVLIKNLWTNYGLIIFSLVRKEKIVILIVTPSIIFQFLPCENAVLSAIFLISEFLGARGCWRQFQSHSLRNQPLCSAGWSLRPWSRRFQVWNE